jgi:hypothetical protein
LSSVRVDGKPTQRHIVYLGGIQKRYPYRPSTLLVLAKGRCRVKSDRIAKHERYRIQEALAKKVPSRANFRYCKK